MKMRSVPALIALGLIASTAVAYTPYHSWRQEKASIDAAVASMTSSDIHGSFNRISAILDRGNVRDLATGDGNDGLLPSNFEAGMLSALQDLQQDLKDHFYVAGEITLEEKCTIMQVIDVVVVKRIKDLYLGYDPGTCIPTEENPCPDQRPSVIMALDGVTGGLKGPLNAMFTDVGEPIFSGSLTSQNYSAQMDQIRATFLTIKGVESIDD